MRPKDRTLSQHLFSPSGRIPRSTFWLLGFSLGTLFWLGLGLDYVFGTFHEDIGMGLFSGVFYLVILYPSLVVCIKRFHDRDRSGWFYLLFFIPLVNFWPLIESYFLKGTEGPNRFGADPLEGD